MAHPILDGVQAVVADASHVRLDEARLRDVASWLAYEALPWPDFRSLPLPDLLPVELMDFLFVASALNFAFTDFRTHAVFEVTHAGARRSDAEAMMACLARSLQAGEPVLDGAHLARLTRDDVARLFEGHVEIPLLERRLEILNDVGRRLTQRHAGRFHRFLRAGPPRLYADGAGLLERLVVEFPSFDDVASHDGRRVAFHKRAQLLFWLLHGRLRGEGAFQLEDAEQLTAFADYIVPAALRLMGVLRYTPQLDAALQQREPLAAGSAEEVEIRAFTVWACHRLAREVNGLRPPELAVIEPVIDARLWTHYHTTHWPHHLTETTAY